ncbi:MAG: type II toxin-antitoxin system YafQ family toxin [Alphaproteobacteria bacterium]
MRSIRTTRRFERDLKQARRRGKTLAKLWSIVEKLSREEPLAPRCRPHELVGEWQDFWECHVEADWHLIWRIADDAMILVRTGSHADLFD